VLSRDGQAYELTVDHRPSREEERERVEREGGTVEFDMLGGVLAVTRALGDYEHTVHGKLKGLSADPDTISMILTEDDEFIVLASDGIWEVIDNNQTIRIVREQLKASGDCTQAAEHLINSALARGAEDNLTVAIISFNDKLKFKDTKSQRPKLLPSGIAKVASFLV
jgi:protein phosphatase 2C family protein 2/3